MAVHLAFQAKTRLEDPYVLVHSERGGRRGERMKGHGVRNASVSVYMFWWWQPHSTGASIAEYNCYSNTNNRAVTVQWNHQKRAQRPSPAKTKCSYNTKSSSETRNIPGNGPTSALSGPYAICSVDYYVSLSTRTPNKGSSMTIYGLGRLQLRWRIHLINK